MSKKKWISKRNEEGVSPVVATILLVAITVVLAALLYIMALGSLQGGTGDTAIIGFNQVGNSTNWTLTIISIQGVSHLAYLDIRVIVMDDNGTITIDQTTLEGIADNQYHNGVLFDDLVGPDLLSAGDRFILDRSIYDRGTQIQLTSDDMTKSYILFTIQ